MTVLLWLAGPRLAAAGDRAQFSLRFGRLKPEYERITEAFAAGDSARAAILAFNAAIDYAVDGGPPVRITFPQPTRTFSGDWDGVVYDPSGRVATATGWRQGAPGERTAAQDVLNLFTGRIGQLFECRPLGGAFFRCWFSGS